MPDKLRLVLLVLVVLFIVMVCRQAIHKKVPLRHLLLWLLVGALMIVVVFVEGVIVQVAALLGIKDASNLVFFTCFGFLFIKLFYDSVVISKQAEQIKNLTQQLGIIEHETKAKKKNI